MGKVLAFQSNAQILERGRLQSELNEMDEQISYLTVLATDSPISDYGVHRRFRNLATKSGAIRLAPLVRKELGLLKAARTRIVKKMENM